MLLSDFLRITDIPIQIISGKNALGNNVETTNFFDNPETHPWLKKGELILTTGFAFKDDEKLQKKIIKHMHKIGCAGLCVKFDRYFSEIPKVMIDLADEYDIPLLYVPINYTLADVNKSYYEIVLGTQKSDMSKTMQAHDELSQASINQKGINYIANILSKFIESPIFITNKNLELLSNASDNKDIFNNLFIKFNNHQINYKSSNFHRFKEDNFYIFEIKNNTKLLGFIFIYNENLEPYAINILNFSLSLLILEFNKLDLTKQQIEEKRSELLLNLFNDDVHKNLHKDFYKNVFKYSDEHDFFVFIVNFHYHINTNTSANVQHREYYHDFIKTYKKYFNIFNIGLDCIIKRYSIIFIARYSKKDSSKIDLNKLFSNSLDVIKQSDSISINICIGDVVPCLEKIKTSYHQANKIRNIAKTNFSEEKIIFYKDIRFISWLQDNIPKKVQISFYEEILSPILDKEDYLLHTLKCYIQNNLNALKTSKDLFIHRNTLAYRLEKIETLLSVDLNNYYNCHEISIALDLYKLNNS